MIHTKYSYVSFFAAPLIIEDSASRIPEEYVVVLKEDIEDAKGIYNIIIMYHLSFTYLLPLSLYTSRLAYVYCA